MPVAQKNPLAEPLSAGAVHQQYHFQDLGGWAARRFSSCVLQHAAALSTMYILLKASAADCSLACIKSRSWQLLRSACFNANILFSCRSSTHRMHGIHTRLHNFSKSTNCTLAAGTAVDLNCFLMEAGEVCATKAGSAAAFELPAQSF